MSQQLASILQKNKSTILEQWEKSLREKLTAARKETKAALRDSVPDFLDDLIIALQTNLNKIKPDIIKFAHKHGSERASTSDYSIEDALLEYNLLRRVIFHSLEAECNISPSERDIILEAINFSMMMAGAEYAKQERSMLESIIEQMPAAVWIAKAPSGEIMMSNSLGKKDLFYQAFHQSGHILARSILNATSCENEIVKIKRANAQDDFIRLDASPILDSRGETILGVAIGTDVTELYAVQEELRVLFELAGTGKAVICPSTGKILRTNKALSDMMKYSISELLNMDFHDLIDQKSTEKQKRFLRKDGTDFWGEVYLSTLPPTPEGSDQSICTVIDVTEQRKTLEAQKQVTDSLSAEQKMRDKFISALSHDLRTPLTTATISSQMIERKSHDPKLSALAKRTSASLNRVAKMIEDLLDANSFQAGNKFIPELQYINVAELAQNTLNELETIYGERFILDSVDRIDAYLSANGIRRVIENLCSNAIKYGSPTAPVTVGLAKEGTDLNLTVHNFGVPLKADETQAVFEQFVRSSSAERSGKMGWGIGLSIVKGVVEAQGGTVDIESDEHGTLFNIRLPLDARNFVNKNRDESPTIHH